MSYPPAEPMVQRAFVSDGPGLLREEQELSRRGDL